MRTHATQHSRAVPPSTSRLPSFRGTLVRRGGLLVAALVSLLAAACDGGGGGGPGGGGTGGNGGTGGTGGNGGTGGISEAFCGGIAGDVCPDGTYCDFPDDAMCGNTDQTGLCEPKPEGCTADCPGVCGCDGQFYCNGCVAAQAGVDVDPNGSCTPPAECGGLAGGACEADEYCDYPEGAACGINDQTGLCQARPEGCPEDCPGVCGCDGQFYCNECAAAQAGVDLNPDIDCSM